jgi:hypothetical protein
MRLIRVPALRIQEGSAMCLRPVRCDRQGVYISDAISPRRKRAAAVAISEINHLRLVCCSGIGLAR